MSREQKVDQSVQTVIRVSPHVLDTVTDYATVTSDKKMQTLIATRPQDLNTQFYSMLCYTPFQDIREDALRVLELPRKPRLQIKSAAIGQDILRAAVDFSLVDDDGVGYICSEVMHRRALQSKPAFVDASVQTDLHIQPHILNESVAKVFMDSGIITNPIPTPCNSRKGSNKK
ncbi:unnamed protein product [Acanthoscelides obtectus]|uniref:Uncharacterized protein n=1 Tax=Acanthoscelides obtectus TaxID=200917 RepID=A0A9P0K7R1_ACAOB|nr:unnamed protein product [Acanthoscelides obtectus]CAK1683098.1 hypothetical protein AOBTE_LOCUS34075 [Acanthoscelides obtectus]